MPVIRRSCTVVTSQEITQRVCRPDYVQRYQQMVILLESVFTAYEADNGAIEVMLYVLGSVASVVQGLTPR